MPTKILIACLCTFAVAQPAIAQSSVPQSTPAGAVSDSATSTMLPLHDGSAITTSLYDTAALRNEMHGGSFRVARGTHGPVLWSQGLVFETGNLAQVVGPDPRALAEGRIFTRRNRNSRVKYVLGASAFIASIFLITDNSSAGRITTGVVLELGGLVLGFSADRDQNAASTALSRAVLLHNGGLPR